MEIIRDGEIVRENEVVVRLGEGEKYAYDKLRQRMNARNPHENYTHETMFRMLADWAIMGRTPRELRFWKPKFSRLVVSWFRRKLIMFRK